MIWTDVINALIFVMGLGTELLNTETSFCL